MEHSKPKLMIKVTYDAAYLFMRDKKKQVYVAKLSDLDTISTKLGISKDETFRLLLDLVKNRLERTTRNDVRKLMEDVMFDPTFYFGL